MSTATQNKNNVKQCVVCGNTFEIPTNIRTTKFCSSVCFERSRIERVKKHYENLKQKNRKTTTCVVCNEEFNYHFRNDRGERKFCSKSCASKFYIKQGTFDSWRKRSNQKNGTYVKCECCENLVYIPPRMKNDPPRKVCSAECETTFRKNIFLGEKNPMFGKKMSVDAKKKQKQTLMKNHGVTNAFFLSKHRRLSKPQLELLDILNKNFHDAQFIDEHQVFFEFKNYYVDIFSSKFNIAVEFNGDYWHCNPQTHSATYFHPKKKKYAHEIWEDDKKRLRCLKEQLKINVFVIWERDFKNKQCNCIEQLLSSIRRIIDV